MKETTLVILAAGIGSRFGGGIKQLAPVGPSGEIIMDYSIYDALKAGFNKIVFIIRKDIEDAFKEAIGDRIEEICKNLNVEIAYAYQELERTMNVLKRAYAQFYWQTWSNVNPALDIAHHNDIMQSIREKDLEKTQNYLKEDLADFCG